MTEYIGGILLLCSGFLALTAALGLVRMPDVLIRMHSSTKAGTLACGLIMVATILHFPTVDILVRGVAIIVFLLLTAPIAAHMIGRAAIRTGVPLLGADGTIKPRR